MSIDTVLNFGKHKGKTIRQLWEGDALSITRDELKEFVLDSINFLLGKNGFNKKVFTNGAGSEFTDSDIQLIDYFFNNKHEYSVKVDYSTIILEDLPLDYLESFKALIVRYFNNSFFNEPDFNALKHPLNENNETIEFSYESKLIVDKIPIPSYVKWCVQEEIPLNLNRIDLKELSGLRLFYPAIIITDSSTNHLSYSLYYHVHKSTF